MVIKHSFHDSAEHFLRDFGTSLDGVGSVSKNLWFDDWDETIVLTDRAVACECMGSLIDSKLTWESIADLEDCSPFCKSTSFIIECLGSCSKPIKSLCCVFSISSSKDNKPLVKLNSSVNVSASEQLYKVGPIVSLLVNSLLEHDHSTNVFFNPWCCEKKLTICSPIWFSVFYLDLVESLSNGSSTLVGSENTFARCSDLTCSLDQLVFEWKFGFDHCVMM